MATAMQEERPRTVTIDIFTYDSLIDMFLVSDSLVPDVNYISTFLFNSKYSFNVRHDF